MNPNQSEHDHEPKPFWRSRYSIGYLFFGGIALYYLLTEHRAHFFGVLPFLFLLACPLMHLFMHHGHGGHGGHGGHDGGHAHGHRDDAGANPPRDPNDGGPS